jgi:hypothetical protein
MSPEEIHNQVVLWMRFGQRGTYPDGVPYITVAEHDLVNFLKRLDADPTKVAPYA